MTDKSPKIGLSILILKDNKVLLGLLSKKWLLNGRQVYGIPGRDLRFRETIGDSVKRNLKQELGVEVSSHKIICVNANYEYGNHYIGIGVVAQVRGEIKLLKPEDWEKWEWFDLKSLPENIFPDAQYTIRCFLENKFCVSE